VEVVESREAAEANGVVVVAVDAEDRQPDVHVRVGVVHVAVGLVAVRKVDRRIADKLPVKVKQMDLLDQLPVEVKQMDLLDLLDKLPLIVKQMNLLDLHDSSCT
jgi:hypothetical protein